MPEIVITDTLTAKIREIARECAEHMADWVNEEITFQGYWLEDSFNSEFDRYILELMEGKDEKV